MRHTLGLQESATESIEWTITARTKRRCHRASNSQHPPRPLVPGVGARVGATNAIIVNMSQPTFDSLGAIDWMENYRVGYFQGWEWCRKQDSNL